MIGIFAALTVGTYPRKLKMVCIVGDRHVF
jgi:hypothetical protein